MVVFSSQLFCFLGLVLVCLILWRGVMMEWFLISVCIVVCG